MLTRKSLMAVLIFVALCVSLAPSAARATSNVFQSPLPVPSILGVAKRQGAPPQGGPGTLGCTQIQATGTLSIGSTTFFGPTYPPGTPVEAQQAGGFWLQVSAGTYTVRASYPGYLPSEKTSVTVSDGGTANLPVNLGATNLKGGDVTGDRVINIQDITALIGKFGQTGVAVRSNPPDCDDPDEPADINDDGKVNIGDLAIAGGNFGLVGATAWAP